MPAIHYDVTVTSCAGCLYSLVCMERGDHTYYGTQQAYLGVIELSWSYARALKEILEPDEPVGLNKQTKTKTNISVGYNQNNLKTQPGVFGLFLPVPYLNLLSMCCLLVVNVTRSTQELSIAPYRRHVLTVCR